MDNSAEIIKTCSIFFFFCDNINESIIFNFFPAFLWLRLELPPLEDPPVDRPGAASVRNKIKCMLQMYARNNSNYGGITAIRFLRPISSYDRLIFSLLEAHISLETGQMLISLTAKSPSQQLNSLFKRGNQRWVAYVGKCLLPFFKFTAARRI